VKQPGLRSVVIKVVAFVALSGLLTTVVITSLLDVNVGSATGYNAEFTNASGLESGDTVRIAGVEVGKVGGVSLKDGHAQVSFNVYGNQHLTTTTTATIHFANLLGQRFLDLVGGPPGGRPLRAGGVIPLRQTTPALDLTAVFNGFEPLFSALAPDEVNELANSIVQVFQGESGTIADLVSQTAVITNNLADRQQVINSLLVNLASLLGTVSVHDSQLGQLIGSFDTLAQGLAGNRNQIGATIDAVAGLTPTVTNLLQQSQAPLETDISGLVSATNSLANSQTNIDNVLGGLPALVSALTKVQSTGSYLNVYVCNLTLNVSGPVDISLIPGISPSTNNPAPFFLDKPGTGAVSPSGPVGNQAIHTGSCQA
jgi:phospholipid/cholesterol/gamma-HCH transport system substrate-binding protein